MSLRHLHVSDKLTFPPDAQTSSFVVLGGKGMGKTNFGSVFCEELAYSGLRFSYIDPMGVAYGLRHSADGKSPGVELLILGGTHGDIPIEPTGGAVVADLVVDESVSVLIDISRHPDGTMWAITDRIRFVRDYCRQLYKRNGEKRRPLMQFIDEAARFAPQTIRHGEGDLAACMGAVAVLVEEGRNVGVGVCLLTQRSARLNKDVAELADCMVAFRTVGPNSMSAVLDWLGEHVEKPRLKELSVGLRALPRGTALVVSPGWLEFEGVVPMRARQTFDSSATPKPGEKAACTSGPGAKPDLDVYLARMRETVERAKENDPKALKAEVARLRVALQKAMKTTVTTVETKEVPVVPKELVERMVRVDGWFFNFRDAFDRLPSAVKRLTEEFEQMEALMKSEKFTRLRPVPEVKVESGRWSSAAPSFPSDRTRAKDAERRLSPAPDMDVTLSSGERKILTALAQYPAGRTRSQVAILTGYAVSGGGFCNYLSKLRTSGLIAGTDPVKVTTVGLTTLGDFDALPTGTALLKHWLDQLGKAEGSVLVILANNYPGALTKEQVAEATGYSADGGGFNNALSRLRTLELIEGRSELRAAEALF